MNVADEMGSLIACSVSYFCRTPLIRTARFTLIPTAADSVDIDPPRHSHHRLRRPPPTSVDRSWPTWNIDIIVNVNIDRYLPLPTSVPSTSSDNYLYLFLDLVPTFDSHEVVYHEITDDDKTFALRLNEKLDVRVAEIAKSEQARKESEEQARKDRQAAMTTRTLTEEEIAEALAGLRLCKVEMVPRITLSVPELILTEPENQDEEDARFAEQQVSFHSHTFGPCSSTLRSHNSHHPLHDIYEQARRMWTDFSRLVVPPSMWTADERGQEIEDEEETY